MLTYYRRLINGNFVIDRRPKGDEKVPIEVFNRYEHKYLIDECAYEKIIKTIDLHMVSDSYNINHKPYTISNIYYDTPDDYLIRTSLSSPPYKEKLRLRSYGIPDKDGMVFLEIKKKFDGMVNKRRSVLTLPEAYHFLQTCEMPEIKDYMNKQVLSEISYFLSRYTLLPKLYLAYDRIAYFAHNNNDLRISFDANIRSRRYDLRPELGDYGKKLLDDGTYLMEIKTSLAKPLWLTKTLAELDIKRTSFSKYGTEYKRYVGGKASGAGKEAV